MGSPTSISRSSSPSVSRVSSVKEVRPEVRESVLKQKLAAVWQRFKAALETAERDDFFYDPYSTSDGIFSSIEQEEFR